MSIIFNKTKNKTGMDKIVDNLVASTGKVTIITGEYSHEGILISLYERVSGNEVYSLDSIEERKNVLYKNQKDLEALGTLECGDSKFTCFNVYGCKPSVLIKELSLYLKEHKPTEILTQPVQILFRDCSSLEIEEWTRYQMYLKGIGVKLIEIEDDITLKIYKNRGVQQ